MTNDLLSIGKKRWGKKFIGVFPQDLLPDIIYNKNSTYYAIINTDLKGQKGQHWVAVAGIPNSEKVMVYDSFGRNTNKLLPLLKKGRTIDTDHDAEQKLIQDSCGQFSLAWLIFLDFFGYKNAKLI